MSIAWFSLAVFTMLMLVVSLYGLAASGHFPREARLAAMQGRTATVLLWVSIIVVLASLVVGLFAAWRLVPWYAAVIGGGGGILVAPLVLQVFSDRFVDGKRGLIAFAGAASVMALILLFLARA